MVEQPPRDDEKNQSNKRLDVRVEGTVHLSGEPISKQSAQETNRNQPNTEDMRPWWKKTGSYLFLLLTSSSFWTAIATLVIAAFTVELYCVSNRQWQTMQKQLEISERPWVTVDNVVLTEPLNWETLQFPRILGKPELRTFINLHAKITYDLNDIGKAPAIKTFSDVQVTYSSDWTTKTFTKPPGAMEMACGMAESQSQQAGSSNRPFTEGAVIFPGRPIHQPIESAMGLSEGIKVIDHIWIVACVAYQDRNHTTSASHAFVVQIDGERSHYEALRTHRCRTIYNVDASRRFRARR